MAEKKDYSQWPLEELLAKEKDLKRNGIISAVVIGFLVGVIIYGVAKNGIGFLHIFLPLLLIYGVVKHSKNMKQDLQQIQSEITQKSTE